MWKWLEQYFTFTKSERNGVIILVVASLVVLVAPSVYFFFRPVQHADNSKYEKEIQAFLQGSKANEPNTESAGADTSVKAPASVASATKDSIVRPVAKKETGASAYFDFDPNKIGVEEWVKLGFTERQAITIEHYKEKGGKFYRPEDLMKLYVMDEPHYNKLLPFVKIDKDALPQRRPRKNKGPIE